MNMLLLSATCLLSATFAPLAAQEHEPPPPRRVPVAELQLRLVPYPENVDRNTLEPFLDALVESIVVVQPGGQQASNRNLGWTDDGWLLMDTAERTQATEQAIRAAIAMLGGEPESQPAPAVLELRAWTPRFVDVNSLAAVLEPLRRKVYHPGEGGAPNEMRLNLSFQPDPALILLHDTPAHVARMVEMLERFDRPAEQVLLSLWLLGEGDAEGPPAPAPPAELAQNLAVLVPWTQGRVLATAMLRTSVSAGQERRLLGTYGGAQAGESRPFELTLRLSGLDVQARQLAIDRIQFKAAGGEGFDTSAVLGLDEYTVLGMAGERPLLVALRVSTVGR